MARLTTQFFQTILKMEGGFQAHPDDNGNYCGSELIGTNMGVSAVAYSTWSGNCPTVAEMQSLDKQTAFNFYAWYFDRYNLYPIHDQKFFELLANNTMGSPGGAVRAEQRALNRMGYTVAVDGSRGQQTLSALNDAWKRNPSGIYNLVREEWIRHLESINKPQFLQGWMYRMNRFFPPLKAVALGGGVLALVIAGLLIYFLTKKRA